MAALFPKIYDVIHQNPHKHEILRWREPTSTEVLLPEQWDIFTLKPLDPPGALSFLLFHTEPMYELSSNALRKQLLVESLLQLHERIDKELVGRRYPRKKIQDLLAGEMSSQKPSGSPLLEDVLCELYHVQKIHMNRRTKSISFSPPDLRSWTSRNPVYVSEDDNTWVFTPTSSCSFTEWLTQKEEDGWSVSWPTAEGKFEELKTFLVQKGISFTGKQKKDDLAHVVGRAQALQSLEGIQLMTHS